MTTNEAKAVAWYAETYNCVPQLSALPTMRFMKKDGTIIERHMPNLMADWERWRKAQRKKSEV